MDNFPGVKLSAGMTASSPSSSTTGGGGGGPGPGPIQSWREGIAKAQERINALKDIVGPLDSLENLQESERPARGLLEDEQVAQAILFHLTNPSSGHGHDALCQWLYDTFQTGDPDLQVVVLRYIPALCGLYLPRILSRNDESLAGFEAVLLALYGAEAKGRQGSPIAVNIPDLSQPSLYHAPRILSVSPPALRMGQLSASLEPQDTVKATKRACIVAVALDLFSRKIATMPQKAKIEACQCALRLATLSCSHEEAVLEPPDYDCATLEDKSAERTIDTSNTAGFASPSGQKPEIEIVGPGELFLGNKSPSHQSASFSSRCPPFMKLTSSDLPLSHTSNDINLPSSFMKLTSSDLPLSHTSNDINLPSSFTQAGNGARIPLPWELIQPLLRILSHCLLAPCKNSEDVKGVASAAVKVLYRRAFHDLVPEAMLAARSLMRLESASKQYANMNSVSGTSTASSSKPRKPEILLVSK
ncbi:hypothetical protein L7F22_002353 [Adiantum nelumboides]|nr:hypothetical protein [Adiantum nelumboides]